MTNSKRAVVLVSGGLDSATCLMLATREGYEVYALSFDYGQRHLRELESAQKLAKQAGAKRHVTVTIDLRSIGGSALTGDIPVPKAEPDDPVAEGIPATYVPARNTIFLSVALGYAEVLEATAIFTGVNAVDYSGYPDCRPEFIAAFEQLAKVATKAGIEGHHPLHIRAPLIRLTKGDIVKLAHEIGVDFAATWSCYDPMPDGRPCGCCDSCRLRAKGFKEAGLKDPLAG